jgi:hypothetical protein
MDLSTAIALRYGELDRHEPALARGVVREVRSKLETGLKSPRRAYGAR